MMIVPFAVGCLALFSTGRALVLGGASASGDAITREDEPMFYWFCIAVGLGIAALLFYISLRGEGS